MLDIRFAQATGLGARPDVRTLQEQCVDVGGRVPEQMLERPLLAAVATDVAGVQKPNHRLR